MSTNASAGLNFMLGDPTSRVSYKKKNLKQTWYQIHQPRERKLNVFQEPKEDMANYMLDFRKSLPKLEPSITNPDGNKQLLDSDPFGRVSRANESQYSSLPAILNRSSSIAKLLEDGRRYLENENSFNTSRDFSSSKNRNSSSNLGPYKNYWNPRPLGRYSEAMAIRRFNKELAENQKSQVSFNVRLDTEQADLDGSQITRPNRKPDPTFVSDTDLYEFNSKRLNSIQQEELMESPPIIHSGKNNIYKLHALQKPMSISKLMQEVNSGKTALRENKFSPVKANHFS